MFILPHLKGLTAGNIGSAAFKNASLDLKFADNTSLVDAVTGASLVTHTRASSGTYVDSTGVLRSAVTNLLLRSEEFDNASWSLFGTASRTANTTVAPNGTTTADSVTLPVSSGIFQIINGLANTAYTFSIWIRCDTTQSVRLVINTNLSDPTTLTVTATSTWQRFNITKTTSGGTTTVTSQVDTGGGNTFFLWGAQLEQSATVGEYIPTTSTINSAPRFDHDPVTGESLGLLVEEARTNSIRNNTMVGAVAGTPGTVPTNWLISTATGNLTSREIVGTGTENGISYIDVRFVTSGSFVASIYADSSTGVAASNGQTWASSFYIKLAAGSLTNVTVQLSVVENDSGGGFLAGADSSTFVPTSAALITQRQTQTRTNTNASTAFEWSRVRVNFSGAGDVTLRIGLPQLEQGAFATSVIPTTTTTVTRAADVASITGSSFLSWYNQTEGAVFVEALKANAIPAGAFNALAQISDGTNNNSNVIFQYQSGGNKINYSGISSGVTEWNLDSASTIVATSTVAKVAGAYALNNIAFSVNAATPLTDTSALLPIGTDMYIGNGNGSDNFYNGTIKRLTYWPTRLSNEVLQQITQ